MDVEALLLEKLSHGQLEELVAERISSFHGLLTREVALRLIAKEKGLLEEEEKKTSIAGIAKDSRKISLEAKVKKIWPTAKYRSGKQSRVIGLEDGSGEVPLVLWNDDVALAQKLSTGDSISVKGAYEKNRELHLGHMGEVRIIGKAGFTPLESLPESEYVHVRGTISSIQGLDRFVDGSSSKPAFSFYISDGSRQVQVLIWKNPERGSGLKEGDEVMLEDALTKNGRLELSLDARVLRRRKGELLLGKILGIEERNDGLDVLVGERRVALDRENSLRFMGIEAAEDIRLSAVVKLKKDYLANKDIALKIRDDSGKITILG